MRAHSLLVPTALCVVASNIGAMQRPPAACDQLEAAVRADPNNLQAAASLGRCSVRDYEMVAPGGDSSRLMFRSSWSVALRALRHAVELDPSYSNAYRPLFRILFSETRDGCSSVTWVCGFVSSMVRVGDSVQTIPRPVRLNVFPDTYDEAIAESQTTRRANLTEARERAERWVTVAPGDHRPYEYLGRALLGLGDVERAVAELERAATLGTPASRRELFWDRIEALVKANRGSDARRVVDEAASDPGRDTTAVRAFSVAALNALLGRNRPPPLDSARARLNRARFDSMMRSRPPPPPAQRQPSISALLAAGDTNGARQALARHDAQLSLGEQRRFPQVGQYTLYSAEQHLALGDTAVAVARLSEIERVFDGRMFRYSVSAMNNGSPSWSGRAWLLSGDVAARQGRMDEAEKMYRRVIGLWEGADAEVQPLVARARERLTALSSRK